MKFVASAAPTSGLPSSSLCAPPHWPVQLLLITAAALLSPLAVAQTAALLYKEADLSLGQKLLLEHRCAECHSRKVGGDGAAIYRQVVSPPNVPDDAWLIAEQPVCREAFGLL